jgi:hypothetical protein
VLNTDKRWSATADVTHLQAYLQPGQPTRFALANLLSTTYNVPIWAHARLDFFWADAGDAADAAAHAQQPPAAAAGAAADAAAADATAAAAAAAVAEDVPHEVLPLVLPGAGDDATVSVAGQGDE